MRLHYRPADDMRDAFIAKPTRCLPPSRHAALMCHLPSSFF